MVLLQENQKLSASAVIAIVAASLIVTGVCVITIINMKARSRGREDETMVVGSTPLASSDSNVMLGKLVLFSRSRRTGKFPLDQCTKLH